MWHLNLRLNLIFKLRYTIQYSVKWQNTGEIISMSSMCFCTLDTACTIQKRWEWQFFDLSVAINEVWVCILASLLLFSLPSFPAALPLLFPCFPPLICTVAFPRKRVHMQRYLAKGLKGQRGGGGGGLVSVDFWNTSDSMETAERGTTVSTHVSSM